MESLSDCLELVRSTWLATPFYSCFKKPQDGRNKPEPAASAVDNQDEACYDQPTPHPPLKYDVDRADATPRSSHRQSASHRPSSSVCPSAWLADSRLRTSGSFSRKSLMSRRSTLRRPATGAPSEFRRVQSGRILPLRRTPPFRPLQLSIYLPGNELPDLPVFWEDEADKTEDMTLQRPAQALLKSRSDPMLLSHPSSCFSIPRKPLPTRTFSMDTSRLKTDSQVTLDWVHGPSKSRSIDHLRSKPIERRPSFITSRSAQDFLDALDSRSTLLPRPPPAATRSNSEPTYTVYRRASEQSLRLRTHLEERQSLEGRLPNCATIQEEISPMSPRPVEETTNDPSRHGQPRQRQDSTKCDAHAEESVIFQARSSSGSSTLLNQPFPLLDSSRADITPGERPMMTATVLSNRHSSLRNRISQWIQKALPALPVVEHSSSSLDVYEISGQTELNSVQSSLGSQHHTKQDSMSSYWTVGGDREEAFDVEKMPLPIPLTNVGVAF